MAPTKPESRIVSWDELLQIQDSDGITFENFCKRHRPTLIMLRELTEQNMAAEPGTLAADLHELYGFLGSANNRLADCRGYEVQAMGLAIEKILAMGYSSTFAEKMAKERIGRIIEERERWEALAKVIQERVWGGRAMMENYNGESHTQP